MYNFQNLISDANMDHYWVPSNPDTAPWTKYDHKMFENALVEFPEGEVDRWQKISVACGKTLDDVRAHYDALVHDIFEIESGRVEPPNYADDAFFGWEQPGSSTGHISFGSSGKSKHSENERKKGSPWTEEEHRRFLIGLEKYGKGDWRSISRNVVKTRTPTQVASHAQKYFLRQTAVRKERKRSSIHDITTPLEITETESPPNNLKIQGDYNGLDFTEKS